MDVEAMRVDLNSSDLFSVTVGIIDTAFVKYILISEEKYLPLSQLVQ